LQYYRIFRNFAAKFNTTHHMPKVLLYITARITWIFLFYGTDFYENRAHVHIAKRGMEHPCKIWLEPEISVADMGDLTQVQINQLLPIVTKYQKQLLQQWNSFKRGEQIKIRTIKSK
jgi:hypothetical protein